ncbi:MAG TPA: glycosyltransferase [Ilumatobacteraceae bacterium]|nr:glycosyltransferase [Ilumatobacteraceae bacterium]
MNLVGYHQVTSGLATAARTMERCFRAAGVDVRPIDVTTTNSPVRRRAQPPPDSLHPATVAVVTAAELPRVWNDLDAVRSATHQLVGVWFWELSTFPPAHQSAIDLVDEIWAPTTFIRDAYEGLGRTVNLAPLPLLAPQQSTVGRQRWSRTLSLEPDDFVFLTSFDLFSIIHRKNPLGVVEAFMRAFGPDVERPVRLILKVLNGGGVPHDLELIRSAAAVDPRITIIDEHLDDDLHQGLVSAADCFVSLHRSEGLGLQLADAMWSGTAVLATRYGGNLDFMDDSCAALVDARLVRVGDGRGAYPDDALWGEPDLEQAASWMRRLVTQPELVRTMTSNALNRMRSQPSASDFGHVYEALLKPSP